MAGRALSTVRTPRGGACGAVSAARTPGCGAGRSCVSARTPRRMVGRVLSTVRTPRGGACCVLPAARALGGGASGRGGGAVWRGGGPGPAAACGRELAAGLFLSATLSRVAGRAAIPLCHPVMGAGRAAIPLYHPRMQGWLGGRLSRSEQPLVLQLATAGNRWQQLVLQLATASATASDS